MFDTLYQYLPYVCFNDCILSFISAVTHVMYPCKINTWKGDRAQLNNVHAILEKSEWRLHMYKLCKCRYPDHAEPICILRMGQGRGEGVCMCGFV